MFDFNIMLHDERTRCLRSLPKFSGTVLSAGCAGTWYFNWFEDCTGHSGKHIGIELYSQKPADLPANVEWTANSVGDMCDVESSSVDVVFSGQNINTRRCRGRHFQMAMQSGRTGTCHGRHCAFGFFATHGG